MKKKIFIPILISFILIFGICVIVNAEGGSDGSSGNAGVGTQCKIGSYCLYSDSAIGMRVTLLNTSGKQIGISNNIIVDDYYSVFNSANKLGTGCSKVQYLNGASGCIAKGSITSWNSKTTTISKASSLSRLFNPFGIDLINKMKNKNFDQIWDWADDNKLGANDTRVRDLYKGLFKLTDKDYDQNVLPYISDLWIVIEPMTILSKKEVAEKKPYDCGKKIPCFKITYSTSYYAGTTYELGKISNTGDAITVVQRKLPCQLYITGSIAEKFPTAPGVNLFTQSYFNGTLKYINTNSSASTDGVYTFSKVCSSSSGPILSMDYVTGNYGGGVGLVYFKDTVKSELTCDIVNKGLGTKLPTFNQKIDNAYKKGGITEIYKQLGTEINFDGGIVNTKWYINECTCYGTYSAYQPDINKTQLYDQPKKIIENLFKPIPNLFTNYFDTINNKLASVDAINKGTTVSWDYNKYENLECGHLDCREVDFKKIDFSKLDNPKMTPEECNETYGGKFPVLYNQQKLKQCIKEYDDYEKEIKNCKQLPLYGNPNYTKDYVYNIEDYEQKYNICFELYNEQFGTNWTYDSYTNPKDDCPLTGDGGETPKKYNCTPKYNVGTCLDGESVFYSDSSKSLSTDEYWKNCVFDDTNAYYDIDTHKVSDKTSPLTYYDKNLSNEYCEVYCTETLTTGFNSDTMTVVAGQYFVWNNHSLSGSRTCRTKSIDWDKFKSDLSAAKNQSEANGIYDKMVKCSNQEVWNEGMYNLDPTAELIYSYKVNGKPGIYDKKVNMDKIVTYEFSPEDWKDDCKDTTVKVGNTNQTIKQCTSVEMTKGATVQFSLPLGLYRYINKEDNISFSEEQLKKKEEENGNATLNYIDVGYGNLPVEFKVPEGYYGHLFGNGELTIEYSDLGHKVGNTATAVDIILDKLDSYNYGNWQCDFIVEDNPLIPDPNNPDDPNDPDDPNNPKGPGGINLIYRPIDLYDPFPDIDGSGRNTGSNWCNYNTNGSDCSNDNQVVYDYILNNRDVEGEEIYLEDPMYTFILTPSIIREIRNYNNQNSYTDYYGSLDDKTYDFKCNEGTGKTCISDYLSHLIEITGAKNQPGTCVDDMFRTYNDPNNFEACRYQNSDWPIFNPPAYENPVEKPDISTH